jgi:hypothetical protein
MLTRWGRNGSQTSCQSWTGNTECSKFRGSGRRRVPVFCACSFLLPAQNNLQHKTKIECQPPTAPDLPPRLPCVLCTRLNQTAERYSQWLQSTLLLVDERWAPLEGVLLQVRARPVPPHPPPLPDCSVWLPDLRRVPSPLASRQTPTEQRTLPHRRPRWTALLCPWTSAD